MTPGYATSEIWLLVASFIIPILNKKFGWNLDPKETVTIVGGAIAYLIGRTYLKAQPKV